MMIRHCVVACAGRWKCGEFDVVDAGSVQEGTDLVRKAAPAYAILDMKLEDGTGLALVPELRRKRPGCAL